MDRCKTNVFFFRSSTYGFLIMLLHLQLQVASSTDTILANQSLSGFQTIVSSGGAFELGFFSPGTSNLFYLGIWYNQVFPKTVVWVANPNSPVYITSISLSISTGNGSLYLYDNSTESILWRGGGQDSPSDTVIEAVLLDNGNLVLRDGSNSVLWQSFDNPSDTWFPGAKIRLGNPDPLARRSNILTSWKSSQDPSPGPYSLEFDRSSKGDSLFMVWSEYISYYQLGIFEQDKVMSSHLNLSFEKIHVNGSYYITYSVRNQNPFRLVMDVSGLLIAYSWVEKHKAWDSKWSAPSHRCKVYGSCGSFGICNENSSSSSSCECIHIPWHSFQNSSSGSCVSQKYLYTCAKASDKFLPLRNVRLASDPEEKVLTKTRAPSCESACLKDCYCKAYAYDGNRCLIWTSKVFNLQQLGANNSQGRTFYVRVIPTYISPEALNSGNPASLKNISGRTNHRKVRTIVLAVLLPSIAATALFIIWYRYFSSSPGTKRAKQDKKQSREILEGGIIDAKDDHGEQMFYLNLHDIMAATNSFSEENKLGEGGFGPVYKGNLPNGIEVAIKRLSKKSSQGLTEFRNEVVLIIKLQHKNLVRLLGYCVEGDEKLLIYEYMSNKSLDALLFDPLKCKELDWEKRMKIVIGTTKGLQYLHEDSRLKIIHRDLKASNILLDDEMNPKISDFGTARIFGCKQIDDSTERIVGTFGYMSPEYALRGVISEKSDIYSFGVLLLEIISGKKATRFVHNDQKHSIIAYGWESWCETKGVSIVDEALGDSYSLKDAMRCVHIALLCVQDHPKDRPTISQIVYMLSNDHDLPVPIQPTFTNVLNCNHQLAPSNYVFSINEATQTTMEGR